MTSSTTEKLIRPDRYALLVQDDTFARFDVPVWSTELEHARRRIESAILAVGRIEDERGDHIGTGWLVAPGLVVTNRHVALEFAYAKGPTDFDFRSLRGSAAKKRGARIDFKEEDDRGDVKEFIVTKVRFIAPDDNASPDIALLEIADKGTSGEAQPSPLALFSGSLSDNQLVAAIGYPAFDPGEQDQALMSKLFGGRYGVKRLSPGWIMAAGSNGEFNHDCATLGGSSGSAVIDLATGGVVGLHFAGVSGRTNWAVDASTIARVLEDSKVTGVEKHGFVPVNLDAIDEARGGSVHPPSHFEGRDGYNPKFLGTTFEIPLPSPISSHKSELAMLSDGAGTELKYMHFSTRQHKQRRFPWITAVNIDGTKLFKVPRQTSWYRDGRLAAKDQVGNEVYTNSGFSRGHMVRRNDPVWGDSRHEANTANSDTFVFTNACPQEQDQFNDALWGDLEDVILNNTRDEEIKVSVFTGPIFRDDDPFLDDAQIPMEFYKIVAWRSQDRKTLNALGFVLSQANFVSVEAFRTSAYASYEVRIADIGKRAKLDFGAELVKADLNGRTESATELKRRVRSVEDLAKYFAE